MIVGDLKPINEIRASIQAYQHILILGCSSCVTVCLSGGLREADQLALALARQTASNRRVPTFTTAAVIRQCEHDLVAANLSIQPATDAILSLACGCGVQTLAGVFDGLPIIPALNTTFLGSSNESGVWQEVCRGCGDCVLAYTGGICPVARCAKSLFNGPCGGSQGGRCEIYADAPCAWAMIYYRLKKLGRLEMLDSLRSQKDWRPAGAAGPRIRRRTGIDP